MKELRGVHASMRSTGFRQKINLLSAP
jgi:hypothetical protein